MRRESCPRCTARVCWVAKAAGAVTMGVGGVSLPTCDKAVYDFLEIFVFV